LRVASSFFAALLVAAPHQGKSCPARNTFALAVSLAVKSGKQIICENILTALP